MCNEIKWMEYNGKKIIDNDLSSLSSEKFINKMNKFENAVISQNDRKLLVLSDVENTQFSPASMVVLKKIAGTTAPYIKKYAIVGVGGIKKILFQAVQVVSTTSLKSFDSLEEAKKWIVE